MSEKNEWKLVPVVPTDEMEAAAEDDYEQTGATFPRWKSAYAAMLAAAPSCLTCGGHGMVGGLTPHSGYDAQPCPNCSPTSSAPGDAQDERLDWMTCDMRHRMVTDNLRFSASHMRDKEHRCRNAYQLEYMGAPMRWLADAYAEAAAVFEAKLAALAAQVPQQGEA